MTAPLNFPTMTSHQFHATYRRIRPLIVGRATYYPIQKIWTKPHGGANVTREWVMRVTGLSAEEIALFEARQHIDL